MLEKTLESPGTARRANQSILKEINCDYSLEGLMLRLKLQIFGHLVWRADSLEKTLMLERLKAGDKDQRRWNDLMASPTRWTWIWASSGSWWWTGKSDVLHSMVSQKVGNNWATELNWIEQLTVLPKAHTVSYLWALPYRWPFKYEHCLLLFHSYFPMYFL